MIKQVFLVDMGVVLRWEGHYRRNGIFERGLVFQRSRAKLKGLLKRNCGIRMAL